MSRLKQSIQLFKMSLKKMLFKSASNCKQIKGKFIANQPLVLRGLGKISFGDKVSFGIVNSPRFLSSYAFIESRLSSANVTIGNNVSISNDFSIESEYSVTIQDNVVIGFNCNISDSNFHDLNPNKRDQSDPNPKAVLIKNNTFIGNNVSVLKGVTLGNNVIVGANSVVTKSFPDNVIIAGNPAKIINTVN
jgi:maltose O-acetyltransferase